MGGADAAMHVGDPYINEPTDRHAALRVRSQKPMNAETPMELLTGALVTPNELFYIRNHLPVPDVDGKKWRMVVGGEGLRGLKLSLRDLKTKFKKHSVTATVQCAGNRRNDLMRGETKVALCVLFVCF
jgi:sulfite oxidase